MPFRLYRWRGAEGLALAASYLRPRVVTLIPCGCTRSCEKRLTRCKRLGRRPGGGGVLSLTPIDSATLFFCVRVRVVRTCRPRGVIAVTLRCTRLLANIYFCFGGGEEEMVVTHFRQLRKRTVRAVPPLPTYPYLSANLRLLPCLSHEPTSSSRTTPT